MRGPRNQPPQVPTRARARARIRERTKESPTTAKERVKRRETKARARARMTKEKAKGKAKRRGKTPVRKTPSFCRTDGDFAFSTKWDSVGRPHRLAHAPMKWQHNRRRKGRPRA